MECNVEDIAECDTLAGKKYIELRCDEVTVGKSDARTGLASGCDKFEIDRTMGCDEVAVDFVDEIATMVHDTTKETVKLAGFISDELCDE